MTSLAQVMREARQARQAAALAAAEGATHASIAAAVQNPLPPPVRPSVRPVCSHRMDRLRGEVIVNLRFHHRTVAWKRSGAGVSARRAGGRIVVRSRGASAAPLTSGAWVLAAAWLAGVGADGVRRSHPARCERTMDAPAPELIRHRRTTRPAGRPRRRRRGGG
jgi:hypothetical protein